MEQQFCCCLNLKTVTDWTESDERQKVDSVACPTADFGEDRTCEEKLCQHECTELDGTGFICSCRPGYEVNPDSTFSCLGTPAAPQELQSDKISEAERLSLLLTVSFCSLADIDECDQYGICPQICRNIKGSYNCECALGYRRVGDGKMCEAEGEDGSTS